MRLAEEHPFLLLNVCVLYHLAYTPLSSQIPGIHLNRTRCALALTLALGVVSPAAGQSVLNRTPNLSAGWTGPPNTAFFNFLHRFNSTSAPEKQVTNSPTFLLAYSPFPKALLGINYATRSDIALRYPNEWEFFARYSVLSGIALQAGYNNAARSADGELSLARDLGHLRLIAVGRAFSNGYAGDSARFAVAGGAVVHVTQFIAVAGDVANLIKRAGTADAAWGAALQLAIPSTPHTLSLQVGNTSTGTLQGSSRGGDRTRYGFEFTMPLHMARFRGHAASTVAPAGAKRVAMKQFQFMPPTLTVQRGTAVAWKNDDQLAHTVTAADKSWTSPLLQPGAVFVRTFDQPGRYEIVCTPHPFMKMIVEVTP